MTVCHACQNGAVKFILHPLVRAGAERGIAWTKSFVGQFDTSIVGWVRIDFGREFKGSQGRTYRKYRGVYGRCWYPTKKNPTFRLSCQVPGPFPCQIVTRKTPVYRNADGSWPDGFKTGRRIPFVDSNSGRCWIRQYGKTVVKDLDEAIVWMVAHEAFHWLRKTRQIPGRNTEIEADAFGDQMLDEFRRNASAIAKQPDRCEQLTFREMDEASPVA